MELPFWGHSCEQSKSSLDVDVPKERFHKITRLFQVSRQHPTKAITHPHRLKVQSIAKSLTCSASIILAGVYTLYYVGENYGFHLSLLQQQNFGEKKKFVPRW